MSFCISSGLICEGDIIRSIDGTNCAGMSAQQLTKLIRGPVDSEATIEFGRKRRQGVKDSQVYSLMATRWLDEEP